MSVKTRQERYRDKNRDRINERRRELRRFKKVTWYGACEICSERIAVPSNALKLCDKASCRLSHYRRVNAARMRRYRSKHVEAAE